VTAESWRVAISRWGDPLWRLAWLYHGDLAAAQTATVQAFVRAFATSPNDAQAALFSALLQSPPRQYWLIRRKQRLPRALRRMEPQERLLLALWLLYNLDGSRLVTLANTSQYTLIDQLVAALLPNLPSQDLARRNNVGQALFTLWLSQKLGFTTNAVLDNVPASTWQGWQAMLAQMQELLDSIVGRLHLPLATRQAIEAELSSPQEVILPWQQRYATWIGIPAVLLVLILIISKPWQQATPTLTNSSQTTPEAVVQQALDTWAKLPQTNTLHRQAWAVDERSPDTPAVITDLWLQAGSSRHRVEVRKDGNLVEWQIADGIRQLRYAANPDYSSCLWEDSSLLDRLARVFVTTPEQQRAARNARMMLGAYGQGYHFLRAALVAPDLHSLGIQHAGNMPLALLTYTDQHRPKPRQLLLAIDLNAYQLRSVRELGKQQAQSMARDLWRLEAHEILPTGVSTAAPRWAGQPLQRGKLLDPACPGIDPEHVVSLRMLADGGRGWYLPSTLPSDLIGAALLMPTIIGQQSSNALLTARATFVGANRWLSLTMLSSGLPNNMTDAIQQGEWRVKILEQGNRLNALVCQNTGINMEQATNSSACSSAIAVTARGWSRNDLLAFIDTLVPVDVQIWASLDNSFLDAHPLDPQVRTVLLDALDHLRLPQDGMLYTKFEQTVRINPNRSVLQDPYHVSSTITTPKSYVLEQWLAYSNDELVRFKQLRTSSEGATIAAEIADGIKFATYDGTHGQVVIHGEGQPSWWFSSQQISINQIMMSLLSRTNPITLTEQSDSWLLEQSLGETAMFFRLPLLQSWTWLDDLPPGTFTHRITIDKSTGLPRHAVMVHLDRQSNETVLGTAKLTDWRILDSSPPQEFWSFPQLPEDTVTVEQEPPNWTPVIVDNSLDVHMPARLLVWSGASGIREQSDRNLDPALYVASHLNERVSSELWSNVYNLEATGLIKTTRYIMPDGARVTIWQGPRSLLRRSLRYSARRTTGVTQIWTASTQVNVVLAGQQRSAWLLENPVASALVVEIDDLLAYITGPNLEYLQSTLLDQIPKLEWIPIDKEK
jgi:hypothetical protein